MSVSEEGRLIITRLETDARIFPSIGKALSMKALQFVLQLGRNAWVEVQFQR